MPQLTIAEERWPIAGSFTISRGAKTEAHVVTVTLAEGHHTGRGECVPYPRYAETVPQVMAALELAVVVATLRWQRISMPDDLLWKQAEISPGEWKASGRVMHPQRVVATIL